MLRPDKRQRLFDEGRRLSEAARRQPRPSEEEVEAEKQLRRSLTRELDNPLALDEIMAMIDRIQRGGREEQRENGVKLLCYLLRSKDLQRFEKYVEDLIRMLRSVDDLLGVQDLAVNQAFRIACKRRPSIKRLHEFWFNRFRPV